MSSWGQPSLVKAVPRPQVARVGGAPAWAPLARTAQPHSTHPSALVISAFAVSFKSKSNEQNPHIRGKTDPRALGLDQVGSLKLILTPGTRTTVSGPQGLGGRQIESSRAGAIAARRERVCPAPCAPPAVPVCAAVRLAGGVSGCTGGRAPAAAAAQVGPVVGHAPSPGAPICEGPAAGPPPMWLSACVARENLAGWGTVTWGLWERYSAGGRIHPEILAHPTSHPSLASPPKTPLGWATLEAAPSPGARLSRAKAGSAAVSRDRGFCPEVPGTRCQTPLKVEKAVIVRRTRDLVSRSALR